MSDATTHLLLPYILAAQAQKHVTHNEALRILDGLVQLSVLDRDLTSPPGSPADGDRYIVASGATGNPAILVYATRMAPTERPDIGYAMIFPSATIVKVIAVQVIGLIALGG